MTDQRSDYGTTERARRGKLKPELTGRGHAVRMRVRDGCELDRLLDRSLISQPEWMAGDTFAQRLHAAQMMGMSVSDLERVRAPSTISDHQAAALIDVTDWTRHLDTHCGERVRQLVVRVCLDQVRLDMSRASSPLDLAQVRLGLLELAAQIENRRRRLDLHRLDALKA